MTRKEPGQEFVSLFAHKLQQVYARKRRSKNNQRGMTDEEFARSIGVERSQLKKYLLGGPMPSLHTVVSAYREHQILVPYDGVKLTTIVRQRKASETPTEIQLTFPFSIQPSPISDVALELKPVRNNSYEIKVVLQPLKRA